MAKEWILNSAMNRFQLNFKRNVGAVSEEIRKCTPRKLRDWEEYYFSNVRTKEHIEVLGRKLYIKITEVISAEVEEITEQDCIEYIHNMVINRTFDGYMTEIKTIYGQLEAILNEKIESAPDEWDRLYNVDFFIKIKDKYIGLQIKPASGVSHIPQIFKEQAIQSYTHKEFTKKFGGKVFYVISIKEGGKKKKIYNAEVIEEIKKEIKRLKN
ncbi:MAG: MjaI family restriction endonuclease [Planctomycetota bacterium]|nr:MAG: MjaI family restriction endonuclease [Planctomycetota bacterium]